jgi:phage tail sheath protein FI
MPVIQEGTVNLTALIVPDVYVQIVPPQGVAIGGVPVNILGIVGSAEWGPVDSPVTIASMSDYAFYFGQIQTTKYDAGTTAAMAVLQGANNMRIVRVTDGTDVKAVGVVKDSTASSGLTVTARYSGKVGDQIYVSVRPGSNSVPAALTYKVTISRIGYVPEVFDNIGGVGNEIWVNIANAINDGQGTLRGKSEYVTAAATTSTNPPDATATANYQLTGGTNGASTLTSAELVGDDDVHARTGMYALRDTQVSVVTLSDCDDASQWEFISQFGASEGCYMVVAGAFDDWLDIPAFIALKKASNTDSYTIKVMLGDWLQYEDKVNKVTRFISPQGVVAGTLVSITPQNSSLNKQTFGFLASQSSFENKHYSTAELEELISAGIDVITYPAPGGNYFAARVGHNASSNIEIHGDNYTRMTNFLAYSLNASMGVFVSRLQSDEPDDELRSDVTATVSSWLDSLEKEDAIDSYSVTCDLSNNPSENIAKGILRCDVKVRYLSVTEIFLINLEGGQTVVTRQTV